jgi:CheY-like chemotaxis protein
MMPQTLARAFEPYFSTKGIGKGTGLGLAVVYGVVRRNNGHVRIESAPQQGTRVEVYWPRELSRKPLELRQLPGEVPRGSETILLVEDFDHLRLMTRSFLRSQGYTVVEAANGEQGLEVFRQARAEGRTVDMVLTDVIMPGMSGADLAQQVLSIEPSTKVLYASGYTGDLLATYGVSERDAALIEKPFSFESLARKIREILDHSNSHEIRRRA